MALPQGVDVASYQSTTFPTAGLAFVFVKATEGTTYVNPRYGAQVSHARSASLAVGHYHFARPGPMATQAGYFLSRASLKAGDLVAFDWEDPGVSSSDKDAWIRYVQSHAPGHRVGLYCNKDYWFNRDQSSFAGDFLWIADPNSPAGKPAVQATWTFHQYSEAGGTDRNVANFPSKQALVAWAAGNPTPDPTPENDVALTDADVNKIVKALTAPGTRDTLAIPNFYWINKALNTDALPTGSDVSSIIPQVAALRAKLKNLGTGGSLTDDQVTKLATALGADDAFVSKLATAIGADIAARMES